MSSIPVITIDGPSGVGKGTLAQYLVCKTGFHLLDSGAIYRALAYGAVKNEIALDDIPGLVALSTHLPVEFKATSILYEGADVTSKVRNEEIAAVASTVAAIPEVRAALLQRQKDFANLPGLVADGRDMGTVVFPSSPVKLYLTASAEIRAERRVKQLKNQGIDANIARITQDIKERDERDTGRKTAPLKPAADAIIIDTSDLDIQEVCQKAESLLWEKGLMK
ncbi:(d)CMP kinase [Thiomicrorhabdus lithotrophica]|uniref:Cytidylate kinase n=1 Tax=Thiomicrorhabdus lithotrophica TaxID=2949997 RepID=A0ABY8CE02_9GAMM|nr:(d)CMP kinase [Thiomicrorhabdus lithotrophica]WEJ63717.1 (d)CMP kinase [Thiomicrorhabdus lithotrophica]